MAFLIGGVISAVHLWDSKILAALAFAVFIRVAAPPVGTKMGQTELVNCNIARDRPFLNQTQVTYLQHGPNPPLVEASLSHVAGAPLGIGYWEPQRPSSRQDSVATVQLN